MHCRSWQWLSIRSTASGSDWTSGRLATGVMLGATIHDVAQVIGAGYAVSDAAPRFGHRLAVCATGGDERCGPDSDPGLRACFFCGVVCHQQYYRPVPRCCVGIRADQGSPDRGLNLGPIDCNRRPRARHVADRHCRARLGSRSDGGRHDPRNLDGRDGPHACCDERVRQGRQARRLHSMLHCAAQNSSAGRAIALAEPARMRARCTLLSGSMRSMKKRAVTSFAFMRVASPDPLASFSCATSTIRHHI